MIEQQYKGTVVGQEPAYHLILGDCLEKMALIPDNSVDMVMADLPYG